MWSVPETEVLRLGLGMSLIFGKRARKEFVNGKGSSIRSILIFLNIYIFKKLSTPTNYRLLFFYSKLFGTLNLMIDTYINITSLFVPMTTSHKFVLKNVAHLVQRISFEIVHFQMLCFDAAAKKYPIKAVF